MRQFFRVRGDLGEPVEALVELPHERAPPGRRSGSAGAGGLAAARCSARWPARGRGCRRRGVAPPLGGASPGFASDRRHQVLLVGVRRGVSAAAASAPGWRMKAAYSARAFGPGCSAAASRAGRRRPWSLHTEPS